MNDALPLEILSIILLPVLQDPETLLTVLLVCRLWKEVATSALRIRLMQTISPMQLLRAEMTRKRKVEMDAIRGKRRWKCCRTDERSFRWTLPAGGIASLIYASHRGQFQIDTREGLLYNYSWTKNHHRNQFHMCYLKNRSGRIRFDQSTDFCGCIESSACDLNVRTRMEVYRLYVLPGKRKGYYEIRVPTMLEPKHKKELKVARYFQRIHDAIKIFMVTVSEGRQ